MTPETISLPKHLTVLSPGMFTTVQDLGRPALGAQGVPRGGVMDSLACRTANRCVGNGPDAAVLEFTLAGPSLRFDGDTVAALSGALFDAKLDETAVPWNTAFHVRAGQTLAVGRLCGGARGVLAIRGGIDVPPVLGSRSTFFRARFGGLDGRPLRRDDIVRIGASPPPKKLWRVRGDWFPTRTPPVQIRVFPGPQRGVFDDATVEAFFSTPWRVLSDSDRMGIRLGGPTLPLTRRTDIPSEGNVVGAIQVASGGLPIILGVDGPVTGGYAKIGAVFAVDIPLLARLLPGDTVSFRSGTLEEARHQVAERESAFSQGFEEVL